MHKLDFGKVLVTEHDRAKCCSIERLDNQFSVSGTSEFLEWFGNSRVVDALGKPLVVYRGEHGTGNSLPRTAIGTYTFTNDSVVAGVYAECPNDRRNFDYAESPRIMPAYLSIKNPIIDDSNNPFAEFSDLILKLGCRTSEIFARKHGEWIRETNNWNDNYRKKYATVDHLLNSRPQELINLYMDAYPVLDDHAFVMAAEAAGYDGAIHAGNGASMDAIEYRAFRLGQIRSAISN